MRLGIGIDTGGTYTDGVIYDFDSASVITRAKHVTTQDDLSVGISGVLSAFPGDYFKEIKMVSLSTTLATNACVEGKGGRTALFLLGYDKAIVDSIGFEYGLHQTRLYHLPGRHGQRGEFFLEPDWNALRLMAKEASNYADALGVVEYWGVRNPEYEIKAKQVLREVSGLPVAAAHELSDEINSLRRAATTSLNARLIPLIDELLNATDNALKGMNINAPLMIVRGDGSLMTEAFARERPVETLLSGPAASVLGGMRLSECLDCLAVDIGGTTTDIAVVRKGLSVSSNNGADVGSWRTGTRAIAIRTIGLGGDSAISFDKHSDLTVGPRRAIPICVLSARHPEIKDDLRKMLNDQIDRTYSRGEFLTLLRRDYNSDGLSPEEQKLAAVLSDGPVTIEAAAEAIGTKPYFLSIENLEFLGIVIRSALTPTDLMHINGDFNAFDNEASLLGAELLAAQLNMSTDMLVESVFDIAGRRLYHIIAEYLLGRSMRKPKFIDMDLTRGGNAMLDFGYASENAEIELYLKCTLPIVGIGAPAHLFLPSVVEKFGTKVIVPADAGVANAVGAITGSILAEETVIIKPHHEVFGIAGYSCHSAYGYYRTDEYNEAVKWAKSEASAIVRRQAHVMGADDVEIALEVFERSGETVKKQSLLLETQIIARGLGKAALV